MIQNKLLYCMNKKICNKCQEEKLISEFNKRVSAKDGYQARCRMCNIAYSKKHYKDNKQIYYEKNRKSRKNKRDFIYKIKNGLKCCICSEDETCCLDFHHRDPSKKDFVLGMAVNDGRSMDSILKEINKCAVVCSNCHRKIHAGIIILPLG